MRSNFYEYGIQKFSEKYCPCKGCEDDRHVGCKSECERYLEYSEKLKAEKERARKLRNSEAHLDEFKIQGIYKHKSEKEKQI